MSLSYKININGVTRDMTDAEKAEVDARQKPVDMKALKLEHIRKIRNRKLSETDYMSLNDYTMPDHIKTWRQSLRDIPANNDSSKYDDLLKRDDKGNLTHTIWTQPTE